MKKRLFLTILTCVLFLGVLSSQKIWYKFFSRSRLYDARFNEEREKRGILPLPADWITVHKTYETKAWFPPYKDTTDVYRSMKMVVVKDGLIKYEFDHIVKPGNGKNKVLVIYSYYDSANSRNFLISNSDKPADDTLTKPQADSILNLWNFRYK